MNQPPTRDKYNWHDCDAVQFNARKLSGRATVGDTRMDADGILDNFADGLTVDEIAESYGVDTAAVNQILEFAATQPRNVRHRSAPRSSHEHRSQLVRMPRGRSRPRQT